MTILDRPPPAWKRRGFTEKVKLQVLLNQDGRSKVSGERLCRIEDVRFDHRPALWERKFDFEEWDTVPAENDPDYIEAITVAEHDQRTFGTKATTAGSDLHRKAKEARLCNKRGPAPTGPKPEKQPSTKPKAKIRSRGFPKRSKEA